MIKRHSGFLFLYAFAAITSCISYSPGSLPARNLAACTAPFPKTALEYAVCLNSITSSVPAKITQKGTKKATAVRIAGSADVFESDPETETKADASKKQTVKGTLEKISMTGMTIKTSDGKEVKFRIVQVPLYLEKGLTKGMSVKITYRGELQSEDSGQESVEVVRIQNAD